MIRRHRCNYPGLVTRMDISRSLVHYGGITKRRNWYLRSMLVQGMWALTRSKSEGTLKERYEYDE
ncbi:MAG: IS110 family transposase [Spirochaetaceae bacterium]|nr:IS110 family transposase [Spirochaetaceae bacterium]